MFICACLFITNYERIQKEIIKMITYREKREGIWLQDKGREAESSHNCITSVKHSVIVVVVIIIIIINQALQFASFQG